MDGLSRSPKKDSATSALDFTGSPAGLGVSRPSSPTFMASEPRSSFARRRASWGRVEPGQDPLRVDMEHPPPPKSSWRLDDDPFASPVDERPYEMPYRDTRTRYEDATGSFQTTQAGPSSVSLISEFRGSGDTLDGQREDDEARLTGNMDHAGANRASVGWALSDGEDPERLGASARSRRRASRYGASPSPLKKTGNTLKLMTGNLRRASIRVVNFAGFGLEEHVRLVDAEDESPEHTLVDKGQADDAGDEEEEVATLPDLSRSLPIRGRTLGCLGPTSGIRMAMYRFLVYPWTEPFILLLIIFNAVVLTMQSHISIALDAPDPSNPPHPPEIGGYFHQWEDYALFAMFCFFTLEAFARMSVSGFLLDPDVPISSLFTSLSFSTYPHPSIPSMHMETQTPLSRNPSSLSRNASHGHSSARTASRPNVVHKLQHFAHNLARPFALQHHALSLPPQPTPVSSSTPQRTPSTQHSRSDTTNSRTAILEPAVAKAQEAYAHMRNPSQPTVFSTALRSDNPDVLGLPFRLSVANARTQTQRNVPYLRHSWTRIDFVAIVGFWVSFALATAGVERGEYHIGIFRALSVLRTARLLAITSGTTTIMRSLKTARPLLASVAYFVLFAMILFSIIGIQSFKGSYLRSCNLLPTLGEDYTDIGQYCGGYVNATTLEVMGYLKQDGTYGAAKGYICPAGQICMEDPTNPDSNMESFDTIYYSALQVFIVASANGWSPIMYNMMDAEFFVSCLFFIACIVVLNFWLINLFIAVITNTFAAIRADTKKSAFGAAIEAPAIDENNEGWTMVDGRRVSTRNRIKEVYESIRWCWVALALASLILQATREVSMSDTHEQILNIGELVITVAFDIEIFIRVGAYLPDWRAFFLRGQNLLDLLLAIVSTVIQIPAIHNSTVYPWFTIFQLARFYRVILEIPRMKPLLLAVFGNMYGLANMTLFLVMLNFIAALVGVQLLRGDIPRGNYIDYGQIYNSFLAAYQLFSSENWTDVLYGAGGPEIPLRQAPVIVLYLTGWFGLANFIVLQMFIAVINENFEIAENSKRSRQASHYWASHRPQETPMPWLHRLNPYRWLKAQPKAIAVEQLPSELILPMQKTLVDAYPMQEKVATDEPLTQSIFEKQSARSYLRHLQRLFAGETDAVRVPLATIRKNRRDSAAPQDAIDEETERHLELLATLNSEAAAAEDLTDILYERRAQRADFIRDHPTYDKTFWLFSQKNVLRRFCQQLVSPAGGERIFGAQPSPIAHPVFQIVLVLAVIGGIVVEWIATPTYRRNYQIQYGELRGSWFDIAEATFGFTLLLEFIIKVIADGFAFTPNAYVRSIWNILDFLILAGILVNLFNSLIFVAGLSRLTRSLKALRALRLITLINVMRSTFESLIISGVARIMDAGLLAILYMIPYAVWGLNIFVGLMKECNDDNVSNVGQCVGEYSNTIYGDSFGFVVPRVWADPSPSTTFSFDNFRASLLILFEIVSLEGWIDVTTVAVSLIGQGEQPQMNARQFNSIFFLIYNLLGAVIILTLFVSIIIGNFTSKTGSAYLTQPQREWIDLQKLIKRQRPSQRPKRRPSWRIRAWCFDRAVHKHGWWHKMMTVVFTLHVIVLMTQTLGTTSTLDRTRDAFFFVVTVIYSLDTLVRFFGLGWRSFNANGWNIFDFIIAAGSLITTFVVDFGPSGYATQQLQKLFITSIAFKLVQRTNSLNKFFKTAVASLPVIISLLFLWVILFFFFAIMYMEVFSMTKWSSAETRYQNYGTMSRALVMLAFMTTGEGWNQYMHDFALEYPRCTVLPNGDSDCGSAGWAFTLFIAWNLLSMASTFHYIFANLFVGVVVESFYYVFQMSGGSKSITREEMRHFKKVWAEFANPKTGYLERDRFVPFFGKLSGIFEVRIYPVEFSIRRIMARSLADQSSNSPWPTTVVEGMDLDKLNVTLSGIDRAAIKRRKNLYNRLYHEARISHEPGKGISFTNMLLLLAHHKLIVDRDALVLKDLVIRTETNKLVTDLVDFDRVQSLLLMISYRRRYLAMRDEIRRQKMVDQEIPAIVVGDLLATPPLMTRDITSPGRRSSIDRVVEPESPMSPTFGDRFPDYTLTPESPSRSYSRRRVSDISMLSLSPGLSPDTSARDPHSPVDDAQNIIAAMQGSIWNADIGRIDMMLEAEEEET
ncbi:Ion transport protein-domain-containing protein [Rhodofomes roseus]|uniref:Ion transport protein-domain-containing protein n=1 Tax=Rhodofomes roseus TaxID=34475 RepID=A0ABQ8KPY3_9APHY|nr:Ion transport protein-domain-containing protein [Rhodofomes roseus]KAH9840560.1 Ion transport protein-domain-containing protein [Rhodofomes roseus]